MERAGAEERVRSLSDKIRRADLLYYTHDRPEIADDTYDKLRRELGNLESQHPDLLFPDSPSLKAGVKVNNTFALKQKLTGNYVGSTKELGQKVGFAEKWQSH